MGVNIARFYKREQWVLDCEIITPMFLGNSNQEAELRAAPFKGLLRYWWRVAGGSNYAAEDYQGLLEKENKIFGSADAEGGGKSLVTVAIEGSLQCFASNQFPQGQNIPHPEVKPHGKPINIDRFLYLGYGPIKGRGQLNKEGTGAFQPGQNFKLTITARTQELEKLKPTLQCLQKFGAIGSRSRNGWGCFKVSCKELSTKDNEKLFHDIGKKWQHCFSLDYPHALGIDGQQLLMWKCNNCYQNWQGVMNELAEKYLTIRTIHKFHGGGPHPYPQDRHVLGYPCGQNHKVQGWGDRHSSALRLLVCKEEKGYRGYFLHLPHLFSKKMWPNDKDRQIKIWQQVHQNLDKCCNRVSLQRTK